MMAKKWRISFEKEDMLGCGAFARVFKGKLFTEDENEVPVAVKQVLRGWSSKRHSKPEDDRELAQLKLDHPNVVKLLHWEDQGEDFRCYALELCDVSLDKVYKDPEKYQGLVPNHVEFILQLSLGLDYIHSQNLIHRDIKSGNVLLSKSYDEGEPPLAKWGDFGFAKTTSSAGICDLSGERGTALYWAPEIWHIWENDRSEKSFDGNKVMTVMSDVFSSGCVFFEFCTNGIHPFGDGEIQIKTNIYQSNPYNLLKGRKLKESHFAYEMIMKMLEREPEVRPDLTEIAQFLHVLSEKQRLNRQTYQEIVESSTGLNDEQVRANEVIANFKMQFTYRFEQDFERDWVGYCSYSSEDTANTTVYSNSFNHEEIYREPFDFLNHLSTLSNPFEEEIDERSKMSIALLLAGRNNQNGSLDRCIELLKPLYSPNMGRINYEHGRIQVRPDEIGYNALHYICMNYQEDNFLEIVDQLTTRYGFDVNSADQTNLGTNALQLILRSSKRDDLIRIIRAFIEKGINLKHQNKNGWTALHYLCRHYSHNDLFDIVKLMIENGAEVTSKAVSFTSIGLTALHLLCENYNHDNLIEIVKLMIENGADVNAKLIPDRWTPLHLLCENYTHFNMIELITLMVEKGVDVNSKTQDGYTAIDILRSSYKHENISQVLQLLSADGNDNTKRRKYSA